MRTLAWVSLVFALATLVVAAVGGKRVPRALLVGAAGMAGVAGAMVLGDIGSTIGLLLVVAAYAVVSGALWSLWRSTRAGTDV